MTVHHPRWYAYAWYYGTAKRGGRWCPWAA